MTLFYISLVVVIVAYSLLCVPEAEQEREGAVSV